MITIKKFGLPSEITEDVIGNHIAFLQKAVPEAEYSNYVVADATTNIELFEYKPAPYKAVRIPKGNKIEVYLLTSAEDLYEYLKEQSEGFVLLAGKKKSE